MPILSGVADLIDRYDGFILDLWGVLHDGEAPYPGAIDALDRLRAAGKGICLLSNAPRRCASVVRKLDSLGFTDDHYDHVMTSGEAAHEALRKPPDTWHAKLGQRLLHIGPERDADIYEGLSLTVAARADEADFVLNTGIDHFSETVADYEERLRGCLDAGLPMVCANPDLVILVPQGFVICAGALAARYEAMGGEVRYHGKPHAPVYRRCFDLLGIRNRARIVAIGDSLRTDIAGANAVGIDAVLVTGGIHREETGGVWGERPNEAQLEAIIAASGNRPQAAMARFVWCD